MYVSYWKYERRKKSWRTENLKQDSRNILKRFLNRSHRLKIALIKLLVKAEGNKEMAELTLLPMVQDLCQLHLAVRSNHLRTSDDKCRFSL